MPEPSGLSLLQLDVPRAYEGLLMGVDYGLRRIGLATGTLLTGLANPLKIVAAREGEPDWAMFTHLYQDWQPQAFIVGIPLNMDDTAQPLTFKARAFALQLKKRFGIPVHGADERLTSREVRQTLFEAGGYKALKKQGIDALAAKLILESWMHNLESF